MRLLGWNGEGKTPCGPWGRHGREIGETSRSILSELDLPQPDGVLVETADATAGITIKPVLRSRNDDHHGGELCRRNPTSLPWRSIILTRR